MSLFCMAAYARIRTPIAFGGKRRLVCTDMLASPPSCSLIQTAASRLAPVLASLQRRQQPRSAVAEASNGPEEFRVCLLFLHSAWEALTACLYLAMRCGASSEAQLQLAQMSIASIVARGCATLVVCGGQMVGNRAAGGHACFSELRLQLELAAMCIRAPGFSAAAAAEAAPPVKFASWLGAATSLLKRLGSDSRTGGHTLLMHSAGGLLSNSACIFEGTEMLK